ncbi:MAG: ribosomal L7Ae/L30e/S12e/Gadd45 family protein [Candidatus Aenigmatarchaeota archaeon]
MNFKIGTREIIKEMEKGLINKVVIASNAPENIKEKINEVANKNNVIIEIDGDERQLALKVGKPFPVACVGYYKSQSK